jgi:DNA polymerase
VEEMVDYMRQVPPWAKGLILNADGYEAAYYKKD